MTVLRWLVGDENDPIVTCAEVDGLFGPSDGPAVLRGCGPGHELVPGYPVATRIHQLAADGSEAHPTGAYLRATVTEVSPSGQDVTFDRPVNAALPAGAREIWDLRYAGGPTEPNGWVKYGPELRTQWSGAALYHQPRLVSDAPPGTTFHLDGRHVTEIEGFWCALGEAVNGPGGYFGWNLDAMHDCAGGGWGADWPFRIVWHDSAVARAALRDPAYTVDRILECLAEDGVEVELR